MLTGAALWLAYLAAMPLLFAAFCALTPEPNHNKKGDKIMTPTITTIATDPRYKLHHIASRRGYVSRKTSGRLEPYSGKFGRGYVAITPRWDTTQYVNVAYYVAKEA